MAQKPNRLDAHEAALTRMLLKPVFGGEGLTYVKAAAWLAEQGVVKANGQPLGPNAINAWWAPRRAELEQRRKLNDWVIEGRAQAEALANAPGFSPTMFLRAGLVQIGALVMKVSEAGKLDEETVTGIKDLFAQLVAGVKEERGAEQFKFDREKFAAAFKSKIEAGLDELAKAFESSPEAMELYRRAREIVQKQSA